MCMIYCGMKRVLPIVVDRDGKSENVFNPKNEPFRSLGDMIDSALEYGIDIGSPAVVQYDETDANEVDVLTDPNHDFFDIAESFGREVDAPAPVVSNDENVE